MAKRIPAQLFTLAGFSFVFAILSTILSYHNKIYHRIHFLSTFYKSAPLLAITFLYQKNESLRLRLKSPVPSS